MKMKYKLRYYPLWAKAALVVAIVSTCALVWLLFGVTVPADRDPEIEAALSIVDADASGALHLLDRYVPRDSDNAARAAALRAFGRFVMGYRDTDRCWLDTAHIIVLRRLGADDNAVLARGMLAYGYMAANRDEYQTAINALGESADRALNQLADTLLAARATRQLGHTYDALAAFSAAIKNFSSARDLFDVLSDTVRADLCRLGIACALGRSFDKSQIAIGVAILDSMKPRMDSDPAYSEYVTFTSSNIQPRMRMGQYDQAIDYGHKTLNEQSCRNVDSLFVYSLLAKAAIRSHRFRQAREWLDSAYIFRDLIQLKPGRTTVSLAGIEAELVDSQNPDPFIRAVRHKQDEENDSLFAYYKRNIAEISPSYTLEADQSLSGDHRRRALLVILLAILLSGTALMVYYSKMSDLRFRMDQLSADKDVIARKAAALAKEIVDAEARMAAIDIDLRASQLNSRQMSRELEDRQALLASTQATVELLTAKLSEARDAAAASSELTAQKIDALLAPYISAVDNLICSIDLSASAGSRPRKPHELQLHRLLEYLRSSSFAESLPLAAAIREPGLPAADTGLRALLTPECHKILMMIIAGFSSQAIITITGLSRQSYYRRRDLIVASLLDSFNDYYQTLADKYIRRFTKTKK